MYFFRDCEQRQWVVARTAIHSHDCDENRVTLSTGFQSITLTVAELKRLVEFGEGDEDPGDRSPIGFHTVNVMPHSSWTEKPVVKEENP